MIKNKYDLIKDELFKNHSIINIIKKLEDSNYQEKIKIIKLLILDGYKLRYHEKIRKGADLPEIYNCNLETLIKLCLNDFDVLVEIIKDANFFYNFDFVSKCILMEEYQNNNLNATLVEIDKSYLLDIFTYIINIDLDEFKEYYVDYLKTEPLSAQELASSSISALLAYKTKELYETNTLRYMVVTLECLKRYYKWILYYRYKGGQLSTKSQYYMHLIETKNLDSIALILLTDEESYKEILENYLYLSTGEVDAKEVDEYYNKSVSEAIKKKLK